MADRGTLKVFFFSPTFPIFGSLVGVFHATKTNRERRELFLRELLFFIVIVFPFRYCFFFKNNTRNLQGLKITMKKAPHHMKLSAELQEKLQEATKEQKETVLYSGWVSHCAEWNAIQCY